MERRGAKVNNIIVEAKNQMTELKKLITTQNHIKTADIRKLSGVLFRKIDNKNIDNILSLCENLLKENSWELGVIAFDWANRVKGQYSDETYEIFYKWLKKYVRGWGECDDFCTHAFAELLIQEKEIFPEVLKWTEDGDFWVRRASAVILIPAIKRNKYEGLKPLQIADKLMNDENELVCKGYGWMLKELSKVDENVVVEYLTKNHSKMPRVSYRYAIEKMDKEKRAKLMSL